MIKIKLYKLLCPFWKKHVQATWDFQAIDKKYWFCKWCLLLRMESAGLAGFEPAQEWYNYLNIIIFYFAYRQFTATLGKC